VNLDIPYDVYQEEAEVEHRKRMLSFLRASGRQ